jgi:hypothetical protein
MCPQKPKEGASCQPLQPRHEWDPKRRQTLSKRGWETGGPGGASPLAGGCGGCPPTKPKEGASCQPLQPRYEWDPKRWQTQSQRGWENGGSRGPQAPWRGAVGVPPPHKDKRGNELPTLANPPRVGPKTQANPQPTGVGKRGSRGLAPWRGAVGGVPPQRQKR